MAPRRCDVRGGCCAGCDDGLLGIAGACEDLVAESEYEKLRSELWRRGRGTQMRVNSAVRARGMSTRAQQLAARGGGRAPRQSIRCERKWREVAVCQPRGRASPRRLACTNECDDSDGGYVQ